MRCFFLVIGNDETDSDMVFPYYSCYPVEDKGIGSIQGDIHEIGAIGACFLDVPLDRLNSEYICIVIM